MSYVVDKVEDAINDAIDIIKGVWDSTRSLAEFFVTYDFDALEESVRTLFRDVIAPVLKPIFELIGIEDETIYSVEVVTSSLVDEEAKYIKTIVTDAVLNSLDIPEELRFAIHTNQRATVRSFLIYGKNHYIDGVPTTTVSEYFTDNEVVVDILEDIEGETLDSISIEFGIPNIDLWCKDYLIDNNSYVISTNTFIIGTTNWKYASAALNGAGTHYTVNVFRDITTTVVVDDYTQVLLDPTEFTDTWTRTTTTIDNGTPSELSVSYVDTNYVRTPTSTGGPYTTSFVNVSTVVTPSVESTSSSVQVPIFNSGGYYSAVYAVTSNPTVSKIWFYETAIGTYPELNNSLIAGDEDNLDTLPIVKLREEFVNVNVDKQSELYTSTNNIINRLNLIDLDSLIELIDDNPDIDLIQDAFLMFGINIYATDQYNLRYLFNFFMALSVLPKYDKTAFLTLSATDQSNSSFIYRVDEGRFNIAITGNYIEITEIVGYIGKIGYVESEITINANIEATEADLEARGDLTQQDPTDSLGLVTSLYTIRAQLSPTTYTEIEVSGLLLTTYILTEGTSVGIKAVELVDPVTGDQAAKDNFIIPISYYILSRMSPWETEQIIYDGIKLIIYAEDSQHLEYYETPGFLSAINIIIKIIAIIILIFSLGKASSLSKALWILAEQLLIQIGLTLALKEILRHGLSDEEKLVLLILYTYASVTTGTSGLEQAATFVDKLLLAVNAISTFVQIDTQNKTKELLEEQAEFESLATTKQEEIEAAEEWLNNDASIDTFNLLNSRVMPILDVTSTPQEFYTRSLTTNLSPILLSQPSIYVDSLLNLDNIPSPFTDYPTDNYELNQEIT